MLRNFQMMQDVSPKMEHRTHKSCFEYTTVLGHDADPPFPLEVVDGRLCQVITKDLTCCLPCPVTDWVYPNYFNTLSTVANWLSVVGALCCVFLLLSYAFLPVDKTLRHYLSISIVSAVVFMNVRHSPASPHGCASSFLTP